MSKPPKIETTNKYKQFYEQMDQFLNVLEDDVTIHPETSFEELITYIDNYIKTHSEKQEE